MNKKIILILAFCNAIPMKQLIIYLQNKEQNIKFKIYSLDQLLYTSTLLKNIYENDNVIKEEIKKNYLLSIEKQESIDNFCLNDLETVLSNYTGNSHNYTGDSHNDDFFLNDVTTLSSHDIPDVNPNDVDQNQNEFRIIENSSVFIEKIVSNGNTFSSENTENQNNTTLKKLGLADLLH